MKKKKAIPEKGKDKLAKLSLLEYHTMLEMALESMVDPIHVMDDGYDIVMLNKAFREWNEELGLEGDVVGKGLFDVFPFLDDTIKEEYARVFASGEPLTTEEATKIGDKPFFTETWKIPLSLEGEVILVITVIRDISERMQVAVALRESEEKYRNLVENINEVIYTVDQDGIIRYISPKIHTLMGYTPSELVGRHFSEFIHKEDLPLVKEGFGSVISGEKAANEYRFITKSGDVKWMRTSSSPVFEGETVVAVHGVILDMTDRRQAEEALRDSEERYSNLFHSSNDAIFVHDLEGNIKDVNRKVLDLFGYSREEVSKLKVGDLHPPRARETSKAQLKQISVDGHVSFEIEFRKKSGDIFPAEVSASVLEVGGEKLIMGIVRDRSGKKRAEELSLVRRDLGRTLSSIGDRKGALRAILGAALKIDGLDGGGIYLFDDRTGELILEDHSGLPEDFVRLISRHAPDSPNAAMVRAGKPVYDHYDKLRPKYVSNDVSDSHFRAIAMIPFEFEGMVLGVINLTSFTQDEMPEITRLTLEAIATEVGSVLARIRAQESVLRSEALLAETQRLTRIGGWEYDVETERVVWTEEMYNIHELPPGSDNDLMSAGLQCYPAEDRAKVETALGRAVERGEPYDLELRFITAKDNHRWIRTTAKAVSRDGRVTRVVGNLMDITERKQAEMEMRRRLMGFDLRDGNLYLVKEKTPTKSIHAFENLLKVGYSGTIISRTPPSKFKGGLKYPFEILWISDKGDEGVIRPFSDDITAWVESLERGHAILMDRLDFMVARKGVKSTVMLIQSLSELAYVKDHIIILSIDPATLEEKELRLVEKEAQSIEPYVESKIPDEYFELIQYVYQQNISGVRPSYSELGGHLGASKPTVRKRVRHLIYEGYLKESAKGRTKVLEVTEKGRRPFTT